MKTNSVSSPFHISLNGLSISSQNNVRAVCMFLKNDVFDNRTELKRVTVSYRTLQTIFRTIQNNFFSKKVRKLRLCFLVRTKLCYSYTYYLQDIRRLLCMYIMQSYILISTFFQHDRKKRRNFYLEQL